MKLYGISDDAPLSGRRPAVTLGMFDGVHRGHQAIIAELKSVAARLEVPTLAITFDPHPRQALGRAAPPAICSFERRIELLGECGLDAVWVLPFTRQFAALSARDFAETWLYRRLDASAAVLGQTAVFGQNREGNAAALTEWSRGWRMEAEEVPALVLNGETVSSTAIRLAVQSGDLDPAALYLGRPVEVEGTVVHGQGRGRKFGFPTINLDPHHELRPPPGVYLTSVDMNGALLPSLTNIGRPPTEDEIESGLRDFLIETHILDYDRDLYGQTMRVLFHRRMREVMRFSSPDKLVEQVHMDLAAAREWFAEQQD